MVRQSEATDHKRSRGEHKVLKTYTVYDNRTDSPLIISGTAVECADAMGIMVSSFRRYTTPAYRRQVANSKKGKCRWWVGKDEDSKKEADGFEN